MDRTIDRSNVVGPSPKRGRPRGGLGRPRGGSARRPVGVTPSGQDIQVVPEDVNSLFSMLKRGEKLSVCCENYYFL